MDRYRLPRPGQLDLAFEGVLLADISSRDEEHQERWSEIRIYKTSTEKYVTEMIGKSIVRGERDRVQIHVADTPAEVIEGLKRTRPSDGLRYLTNLGLEALDMAAEKDPALAPRTVEMI